MADWGNKTRFSIAAFRSLDDLDAAVNALVNAGFSEEQIALAATRTSVNERGSGPNGSGETASPVLKSLLDRFVVTPHQVAGVAIMVSEGVKDQFADFFAIQRDEPVPSGLMAATRAKLLSQLYSGMWLIGANALSYDQLRSGTRILLAHSSDRVETFELHGL